MQPTNGLIIELLDSREAMGWFVDGTIYDMIHSLYFTAGTHSWAMDLLLFCAGNVLCDQLPT